MFNYYFLLIMIMKENYKFPNEKCRMVYMLLINGLEREKYESN